ncbi:MAG: hypothetical protein J0I06_13805 [Planctomycetes bacterium]|nr:hypothetical protein [Planctomycetota bacterium]
MTLLSRRKRRTTARRITPATLAANLAALVALVATPAVAQPPGGPQPGLQLPPSYRPRTPPQPQRPVAAPATIPGGGSAGRIMYFQKPADALTATGAEGAAEGVAMAPVPVSAPPVGPAADVPPPAVPAPALLPPPPPPSRYLPPEPSAAPLVAAPVGFRPQPEQPKAEPPRPDDLLTAQKKQVTIVPVDPKFVQLPPRENIFMVYNDLELEKAIMERLRQDLREQWERQNPDKKDKYNAEEAERYLVFPALPVVSPPGVPYRPKTLAYAPSKVIVEPGYVVHRRLHFEEKNSERYAWDLGPLSTFVSAGYFYRDVLLWPQSLASGFVHGFWDTSAGKCLPGSPVPYYIYPAGLTTTGTAFETLVITGATFIFP